MPTVKKSNPITGGRKMVCIRVDPALWAKAIAAAAKEGASVSSLVESALMAKVGA